MQLYFYQKKDYKTMKMLLLKKIIFGCLFALFHNLSFSQENTIQFQLQIPFQLDRQEAEISYSWGTETQKKTAINFGLDGLIKFNQKRLGLYTGFGIFRNKFNISRGYDHQALNPGRDSLPIGTETNNYIYSILRFPIGIEYQILEKKHFMLKVGAEYYLNFSFRRKYNGAIPYQGANTVYNGFTNFGNSFNIFFTLSNPSSKTDIGIEPFVRIYNRYNKDRFFNEKENESITRNFDAIGISFKYSINH